MAEEHRGFELKTCTRCGETKPVTKFHAEGWRNGRPRYSSRCGACLNEIDREKRAARDRPDPVSEEKLNLAMDGWRYGFTGEPTSCMRPSVGTVVAERQVSASEARSGVSRPYDFAGPL